MSLFFQESSQMQIFPNQDSPSIDSQNSDFYLHLASQAQEYKKYGAKGRQGLAAMKTRATYTKVQLVNYSKKQQSIINSVIQNNTHEQIINFKPKFPVQFQKNQQKGIRKSNIFYKVFRRSYTKRQQSKNKNFVKFLLPKFFCQFNQAIDDPTSQWGLFNRKIQEKKITNIYVLSQLFEGNDEKGFKKQNRNFINQMLHKSSFYKQYLLGSHYIKKTKNRKQYLLAAKLFSLRCTSSQLIGRIQTK